MFLTEKTNPIVVITAEKNPQHWKNPTTKPTIDVYCLEIAAFASDTLESRGVKWASGKLWGFQDQILQIKLTWSFWGVKDQDYSEQFPASNCLDRWVTIGKIIW